MTMAFIPKILQEFSCSVHVEDIVKESPPVTRLAAISPMPKEPVMSDENNSDFKKVNIHN